MLTLFTKQSISLSYLPASICLFSFNQKPVSIPIKSQQFHLFTGFHFISFSRVTPEFVPFIFFVLCLFGFGQFYWPISISTKTLLKGFSLNCISFSSYCFISQPPFVPKCLAHYLYLALKHPYVIFFSQQTKNIPLPLSHKILILTSWWPNPSSLHL